MALTIAQVNPDPVLTGIALQYGTGGGFAQDFVMPTREVAKDEFQYMIWNLRDFIQGTQFDSRRAPAAPSTRSINPAGTWVTGNVHERSLVDGLPDEVINNAASGVRMEEAVIRRLTNALRLEIEYELMGLLTDTATIGYDTPTVKWDASTGTITIEADIDTGRERFIKACGFEPTHILLPPAVANAVKRDSTVRDLRKYTEPNLIQAGGLPPVLFGLNVVVPGAIQDTANPAAAASVARVWSTDKAVLLYVDPSAATDPTAMTSVMRFASAASVGENFVARSWRNADPSRQLTEYQVMAFDDIQLVAAAAVIINDVLT